MRDTRHMRYYAPDLINKHAGQTAFICAAGPSFYDIYVSYLFTRIFDHVVISVNSSIIAMPWKGERTFGFNIDYDRCYWISNDAMCRRWSWWEDVKKSKCIKIVRDSWTKYEDELKDFFYFSPRSTPEDFINPNEEKLAYCSSTPTAIDLAIQMGCKKIILLGLDQKESHGYHHFWQLLNEEKKPFANPPAQGPWEQQKKVFEINNKAFKALHNFAKDKKVDILNCETWIVSAVNEFDKVSWEMLFESEII